MGSSNGHVRAISPAASAQEAAAIVAAIARFMRATAPEPAPAVTEVERWQRVALLEGVEREISLDVPDPWINT